MNILNKNKLHFGLFLTLFFTACFKDPEPETPVPVTAAQTATIIAATFCTDAQGLCAELPEAAGIMSRGLQNASPCNTSFDSTFSKNAPTLANYTYSYAMRYHNDIRCTNNLPSYISFSVSRNGNFESTIAKSNGNGNGAWTITTLSPTDTVFTFNGDYSRAGNAVSKGSNKNTSFSTDLRCTLENVLVKKTTKTLQSGIVRFTITGSSSTSTNYSFNGQFEIKTPTTGFLTIGGKVYNLNLTTGEVS